MALRSRQVHLDFHTSPDISGIGERFDKKQFQKALLDGHANSITVFSKGHHGYSFLPTKVNEMHPGLSFDLLGAQLEACREIGVDAPVYISAGFDHKDSLRHPEWLWKASHSYAHDLTTSPGYRLLCYNNDYLEKLALEVEEVMERYDPCEIFLDISDVRVCFCQNCVNGMLEMGMNPESMADAMAYGEIVYKRYYTRIREAVEKYNPNTRIFHNSGNVTKGRRDLAHANTHLELESLPTGGWGYDHFPMSAAYSRTLGMEYLGMTGKFHTTWGEFGGFKHPNALRYETSLSMAFGAKCSIGDQLHPSGEMNPSTYALIGKAYGELEAKEPFATGATARTDIAILSYEAFSQEPRNARDNPHDIGASRMLLEGKYLFDMIDKETPLDGYKLLILPDKVRLDAQTATRISDYLAKGGKVLATGESGLATGEDAFALDFGARYAGTCAYRPSYMTPNYDALNGKTEYVMYSFGHEITDCTGKVFAERCVPYFNRTARRFSSHKHTPDNKDVAPAPAAVLTANTAYIGWSVFEDYAWEGSYHLKELVHTAIERLIGEEKTLSVTMPDRAVVSLMHQETENRDVCHLLFAHTSLRGKGVEVIESTVPLFDVPLAIRTGKPKRVYLAPSGEELPYTYENGVLSLTVPKVDIHAMIAIEY